MIILCLTIVYQTNLTGLTPQQQQQQEDMDFAQLLLKKCLVRAL